MLGLAFWLIYRPFAVAGASCPPRAGRYTKIVVWFSSVIWLFSFALQFVADKVTL